MHDPVIAADGHTYERHAMEQWLRQHATSPLTGAQLSHLRLVPNIIVRSIVRTQAAGLRAACMHCAWRIYAALTTYAMLFYNLRYTRGQHDIHPDWHLSDFVSICSWQVVSIRAMF